MSGDVADDHSERGRWAWIIPVSVGLWLPYAVGTAAGWSLIAAEAWSWDRFGNIAGPTAGGLIGSLGAQALVQRGLVPTRPAAKRKLDRQTETMRAIRTGTLPPDVDRDDWRERIRHERRTTGPLLLAVVALSPVAAALAALTAHLTSHDAPGVWTMAAVALVSVFPVAWRARRLRRNTRRLLAELS